LLDTANDSPTPSEESNMTRRTEARAFTLVELLVVIVILAILISVLLPLLSSARKSAAMSKMGAEANDVGIGRAARAPAAAMAGDKSSAEPPITARFPAVPLALVRTFAAKVDLTPRLSVGTAEPESIYEARFSATLEAAAPPPPASGSAVQGPKPPTCEICLPLPPQIISLAGLTVTVDKQPSDTVTLRDATLVWTGPLPTTPTPITVTYTAVGKGLYELRTPPGRILDAFSLDLVANGSDVRMLELSLQPTGLVRADGRTTYTWNYQRLMFGRPIAVDVLGVAPVDRLGELSWLGPLSVIIFGLIVGLYAHAFGLAAFDRWMLLMILGAFTGGYPLMYFAQEFIPLREAMLGSAALVLLIGGWRAWSIIGFRHAIVGVLLPAVATLALTLVVATHPKLQGQLLTGAAIVVFIIAMVLIPRVQWSRGGVGVPREAPAA
jgi:prepilin-type N-terminal cleavage/methylation domain-containing protein